MSSLINIWLYQYQSLKSETSKNIKIIKHKFCESDNLNFGKINTGDIRSYFQFIVFRDVPELNVFSE